MENDNEKFPCVVRDQFEKLGTDIDIRIIVTNNDQKKSAENDLLQIRKLYSDFNDIFSRFESDSELSILNNKLGEFNVASPFMCEVSLFCLEYNKKTKGIFDPRILDVLEKVGYADDFKKGTRKLVGGIGNQGSFLNSDLNDYLKVDGEKVFFGVRMDFSGIAKGYINDQIVKFVTKQGWKNFLIDSGGDMFMQGVDEDGKKWTVGVEGIEENKLMFVIDGKGVATSGIGRRRWEIEGKRIHHIINPMKPDIFSFDLKSVTVITESTTEADVIAKTLFLMGKEGGILYARENALAVVILDYRGSAWISPKAKEFVVQ